MTAADWNTLGVGLIIIIGVLALMYQDARRQRGKE